jgi:hypothetical protein
LDDTSIPDLEVTVTLDEESTTISHAAAENERGPSAEKDAREITAKENVAATTMGTSRTKEVETVRNNHKDKKSLVVAALAFP